MPKIVSWLRVLVGVALLLATRWASAEGSPLESAVTAEEVMLVASRAASHEGTASDERIAWHTTLLDNSIASYGQRRPIVVKLARPLAAGAILVSSDPPGAKEAYGDDGAIVAF